MTRRPLSVIVTGTVEDKLNSNVAIRRYIAQGFRDLGHECADVHEISYGALIRSTLVREADLILAVGGVAVDGSDLSALRRAADRSRAALAFWVHDDPYEFDYAFRLRGLADLVFNTDRWATAHYNDTPAVHLPLAGCQHTHLRHLNLQVQRDIGLFFCGYAYENRINFLRKASNLLRCHRTYVCGAKWPSDLPFAHNERMLPDLFADTAGRALFTLNIGRDLNIANARFNLVPSTPGPRTFEVAMMGAAQLYLVDSLEILDYFENGSEIVLIDGVQDLKAWLERGLDDPAAILAIAGRAQERALSEHTYRHRAEAAICHLRARGLVPDVVSFPSEQVPLSRSLMKPASILPMAAE